jgi:hypothetical protein
MVSICLAIPGFCTFCDEALCNDVSSGSRVREEKAGVTGKSYSLERKVSSTKVVYEWDTKRNSKSGRRKVLTRHECNMSKEKKGST